MQQRVLRERTPNEIREGVTEDHFLQQHLVEKKRIYLIFKERLGSKIINDNKRLRQHLSLDNRMESAT